MVDFLGWAFVGIMLGLVAFGLLWCAAVLLWVLTR